MVEKKAPAAAAGDAVWDKNGAFRLAALLRECEEDAAILARRKHLRLYVYDEAETPQLLSGPQELVRRAVAGLLVCSVGSAARGAVTLVVSRGDDLKGGKIALRLTVSDTGTAPRDAALAGARAAASALGGGLELQTLEGVGTRTVLTLGLCLARETEEPIDRALGLRNCAGSEEIHRGALRALVKDAKEGARALRLSALNGDYDAARRAAHTWKGSAATVGAARLAELAAILEEALARDGSYFKRRMLTDYEYELSRVIDAAAKDALTEEESPSSPPPDREI